MNALRGALLESCLKKKITVRYVGCVVRGRLAGYTGLLFGRRDGRGGTEEKKKQRSKKKRNTGNRVIDLHTQKKKNCTYFVYIYN